MNVIQFGDAACGKVRGYLDSYLSNELLVETNHEVLRHLEGCPQCTAELSTRTRVRTGLQAAVRGSSVPDGLEARVQRAVRAQNRRTRAGLYTMAVAATVIIGLAIVNLTRAKSGPEEAILGKAAGRLALVLNVGLRDHLHCAVFRKYDKASVQLSPEFADLARLVKAKLTGDFRIIQGHRCTAGGRQYIHLIVTHGDKLLSLILTRKRSGESLSAGIYQEGVDRFQVVGFESHDYLVYVISDLDAQQNLQLAANIAPAVREYLAAHAG
jgi:anti-sigma factor RsiW